MERTGVHTTKDRDRRIYRRIRRRMGNSHQRKGNVWIMDRVRANTPYQLEGVEGHMVVDKASTARRQNHPYNIQINKFRGTKSQVLLDLTTKIWNHCLQTGTRLKTTYILSQFNPADAPSRKMITQLEWSIDATFLQQLEDAWGHHTIDLFATKTNSKVDRFISWKQEEDAWSQDAFNSDWSKMARVYACPPWPLLPKVLKKIKQDKVKVWVSFSQPISRDR